MTMPWGEIVTGTVAGFALGWRIYDSVRERSLARKYKLQDNPRRCSDHEVAIAEIKTEITNIKEDIKEIKEKLK